ncbi:MULTISPECIES: hypothetical protein [Nostocales]|uniref:Tetratricopeptide repeat protein n=3 Tax=Nostocales TaxID=1161 RepID=A0A0C1R3F9_9CYAN|nr:hypothetical protein [Tolypothrix bouteillei]KAF3886311.1 tetratricopeptide repeat protein [Tolypothrix bouteillei VB521301]
MASSGEEYVIVRQKQIDRRKRLVTWISILSFAGSGIAAVVPTLQQAFQSPKSAKIHTEATSLQHQADGFELVLQREPENRVALEGLVLTRIKLKDLNGAIQPLEKLAKLYPERQDYKQSLEQLKNQIKDIKPTQK